MTKLQDSHAGSGPHTQESRGYPRRKLSEMAYVELAQDNGGILLNLSEGGLAVQSALTLSASEFPELRFQLPNMRGWLTAGGRVAWMSESKKEAGIQFLDLHEHARAQIRTWVAGEGESATPSNGDVSAHENRDVAGTGFGGRPSPGKKPPVSQDQEPVSAGEWPLNVPAESHAISKPIQEDAGFRFHDYSMFAADVHATDPWVEPARRRGWGTYVLFTILLAALFFVLGAMIGRDNLGQFVASVETWKQNQTEAPPRLKPPTANKVLATTPTATPNEDASSASDADTKQDSDTGRNPQEQGTTRIEQKGSEPSTKSESTPASPQQEGSNNDTPKPNEDRVSRPLPLAAGEASPGTKAGVKNAHRTQYATDSNGATVDYGRSILVHPPAPGSAPFFVHLPNEAVSASSWVAISARRSFQVPARADASVYGSERVIIGKLVAHSDPFYPPEARRLRLEGSVELRAVVGRSGQVISVTPVSGPGVLSAAAATALREWRYEPTFINGDPVETQADVTMVFRSP